MGKKSNRKSQLKSSPGPRDQKEAKVAPLSQPVQVYSHRWSFAVCIFLGLAVWAVYGQTFHYDFVSYDDNVYVYANPSIIQGLSVHGGGWIFTHLTSPD